MFVDYVELVEPPERVPARICSIVWLRLLECCECRRSNEGLKYPFRYSPVGVEIGQFLRDWEVQDPGFFFAQGAPRTRYAVEQMIKGRTQLMEHVSKQDPPLRGWFDRVMGLDDYALPFTVVLEPNRLAGRYRAIGPKNGVLEVLEVLFGPFDFQPQ